ncbi:MAG: hypothetical protein HQK76_11355 [Desulfobacterales bacterium]|nr:hypothetical protein [Desulfobacterales bacterium]
MKKWRCSVCGYIHKGDGPPDKCPVCGADKSKFIEVVEEEKVQKQEVGAEQKEEAIRREVSIEEPEVVSKYGKIYNIITSQMVKHHAHPVSVHIPNGVLPVSVIFMIIGIMFDMDGLKNAAFYNLFFVVLSMPLVLFSGYIDWKTKYKGEMTTSFLIKMLCGSIVLFLSIFLFIWQWINPILLTPESNKGIFIVLNLIMLGAAGTAGFFGGKLVFNREA